MAVNFGDTLMEGSIAPSVTVQNPVQDDSGAVLANGFAKAAQVVGQVAGGLFKQQDDNAQYKVLNNYENDFLTIIDSYEQGVYTQQEAMLRARALRSQYLSNAPALRDDFDKVWTQVTKDSGLGHTIIEGTVRDRAAEAMELEGAKLGYTPQQWQQFQANGRVLEAYKQQLELTTTQNGIVTEGQKQRGLELITNVAASAVPAAQKMVNDTIAQLDAAPDASGKAEVLTAFNLNIGNAMASIEGGALGVDTAYITKPMKDLQAMVTEYANGGVELTMLENSIKSTNLMYQQMQMKDPKIASAIATMATFKEMGMQNSPEMLTQLYDPEVLERIVAVNNGTASNFLDNTPASAKTFQTMTGVAATPGLSDQAQGEVLKFTNDVIDGIYKNERSAKDGALGYKDTVTYLASPGVRELIANKGISAEFAAEASDVIAKNYETVLGPAINQYWTSVPISDPTAGETVGVSNIPMNQLLDPVWNGSAVEFIPKPEYANNPRVVALAGDVNTGPNSIGVPLNDNINAQSALTGTDAKSLWEGTYAQKWFGIGGEEGAQQSGTLHPFDPAVNTPRPNADGSVSTELTRTVQLPDGTWSNVPSLWWRDGTTNQSLDGMDDDQLGEFASRYEQQSGQKFPRFDSLQEAESAAQSRSDAGAGQNGTITSDQELLSTNSSPQQLTLADFNENEELAYAKIEEVVNNTFVANPTAAIAAGSPLEVASAFLGLNEENSEQAQVLSSFIRDTAGIDINPAKTAWCAAFIDAVLRASGGQGTGKLNARSYLDWGKPVSQPHVGDIVVFSRGAPGSGQGHVGFYAGMNNDGTIKVLGGNQSNSVSLSDYDASKVLGYRRAN